MNIYMLCITSGKKCFQCEKSVIYSDHALFMKNITYMDFYLPGHKCAGF